MTKTDPKAFWKVASGRQARMDRQEINGHQPQYPYNPPASTLHPTVLCSDLLPIRHPWDPSRWPHHGRTAFQLQIRNNISNDTWDYFPRIQDPPSHIESRKIHLPTDFGICHFGEENPVGTQPWLLVPSRTVPSFCVCVSVSAVRPLHSFP